VQVYRFNQQRVQFNLCLCISSLFTFYSPCKNNRLSTLFALSWDDAGRWWPQPSKKYAPTTLLVDSTASVCLVKPRPGVIFAVPEVQQIVRYFRARHTVQLPTSSTIINVEQLNISTKKSDTPSPALTVKPQVLQLWMSLVHMTYHWCMSRWPYVSRVATALCFCTSVRKMWPHYHYIALHNF